MCGTVRFAANRVHETARIQSEHSDPHSGLPSRQRDLCGGEDHSRVCTMKEYDGDHGRVEQVERISHKWQVVKSYEGSECDEIEAEKQSDQTKLSLSIDIEYTCEEGGGRHTALFLLYQHTQSHTHSLCL